MTHNQAILCIETLKRYFKDEKFGNIFDKCPKSNRRFRVKNFKYMYQSYYNNGVFDIMGGGKYYMVGYFDGNCLGIFTEVDLHNVRFEDVKDFFKYFKIPLENIV